MILTRRDFSMIMAMLAIVLLGFTYLIGAPLIEGWRQSVALRERMSRDRDLAERMIASRGEWAAKLDASRGNLPSYGINEAVGADLLRRVRKLADENGVRTSRMTPDAETNIGDLYEQAIEVAWEASLEPLVRFLYAVQVAGATLDIRQMTMTPSQGDQLKGNLKIYFAYQRASEAAPSGETP